VFGHLDKLLDMQPACSVRHQDMIVITRFLLDSASDRSLRISALASMLSLSPDSDHFDVAPGPWIQDRLSRRDYTEQNYQVRSFLRAQRAFTGNDQTRHLLQFIHPSNELAPALYILGGSLIASNPIDSACLNSWALATRRPYFCVGYCPDARWGIDWLHSVCVELSCANARHIHSDSQCICAFLQRELCEFSTLDEHMLSFPIACCHQLTALSLLWGSPFIFCTFGVADIRHNAMCLSQTQDINLELIADRSFTVFPFLGLLEPSDAASVPSLGSSSTLAASRVEVEVLGRGSLHCHWPVWLTTEMTHDSIELVQDITASGNEC
jgi:hypothetical protein